MWDQSAPDAGPGSPQGLVHEGLWAQPCCSGGPVPGRAARSVVRTAGATGPRQARHLSHLSSFGCKTGMILAASEAVERRKGEK